jgi:hypothetical protein
MLAGRERPTVITSACSTTMATQWAALSGVILPGQ